MILKAIYATTSYSSWHCSQTIHCERNSRRHHTHTHTLRQSMSSGVITEYTYAPDTPAEKPGGYDDDDHDDNDSAECACLTLG